MPMSASHGLCTWARKGTWRAWHTLAAADWCMQCVEWGGKARGGVPWPFPLHLAAGEVVMVNPGGVARPAPVSLL